MSDGKEQYADSAFNKAAEAAVEEYKKKHYETWHMGADLGAPEGDRTAIHAMQEAEVDKLESRQYDYLRNWQGDTNTWVAPNDYRAWTAPRNQYEPLFPNGLRGAAIGPPPYSLSGLPLMADQKRQPMPPGSTSTPSWRSCAPRAIAPPANPACRSVKNSPSTRCARERPGGAAR